MSSTADIADRRVAGLGRRRIDPDPARLIAANRPTPPPAAAEPLATDTEPSTEPAPEQPADQVHDHPPDLPAAPTRTRTRRSQSRIQETPPAAAGGNGGNGGTDAPRKLTVYMHPSIRDRAAVAFKATAY